MFSSAMFCKNILDVLQTPDPFALKSVKRSACEGDDRGRAQVIGVVVPVLIVDTNHRWYMEAPRRMRGHSKHHQDGPAEALGVGSARVRQLLEEAFGGRYDPSSTVFDRIADHLGARRNRRSISATRYSSLAHRSMQQEHSSLDDRCGG